MRPVTLESLPLLARQLAGDSLAWMEPFGDPSCNLLRYPGKVEHYGALAPQEIPPHLVRESAWWATGLMLRNQGDDAAHAEKILEAVLRWQFNEPGQPYHGTFHRAPEEKLPPKIGAVMWQDYDPNWRQFIGTTFLVLLEKMPDRVSPALRARLEASIRLAVEGETPERIYPSYSNIAMMHAVLLVHAGVLFHQPKWQADGVQLAREVFDLFAENETFSEYNSPTYYGVILLGLRLWRLETSGPDLQAWGAKMEAALWRHIGRFYHPILRNICGPFDRAYGMDMTQYIAGIGTWMRLEFDAPRMPAPLITGAFHHSHDLTKAPLVALLGNEIPADVREQMKQPPELRNIEQIIEAKPTLRIATACLKADCMWGAESGSLAIWDQFHPATAHWLQPDGTVGWLRLENKAPVDATANDQGLTIMARNGKDPTCLIWHLSVKAKPSITHDEWRLPGMIVRPKTTLPEPVLKYISTDLYTLTYGLLPSQKATLELEFLSSQP